MPRKHLVDQSPDYTSPFFCTIPAALAATGVFSEVLHAPEKFSLPPQQTKRAVHAKIVLLGHFSRFCDFFSTFEYPLGDLKNIRKLWAL
jgi:hypothetical protein